MKNKFISGFLIAILFLLIGCSNSLKSNNKEIIVIDEETNGTREDKSKLEIKVLYKIKVDNSLDEHKNQIKINFINENIFEITFEHQYKGEEGEFPKNEIVKVRMGKIEKATDSSGLNNITWRDLEVEGYLLKELSGTGTSYKIIKDNKVYNLSKDGELIELKAYENVSEEVLKSVHYYHNLYNDDANILYLDSMTKLAVIDIENNKVINSEDKGFEEMNMKYNIFAIEDNLTFVWYLDIIKDKDQESELKIGFIKDNKFQDIFENKNLFIGNQKLTEIVYGYAGENKVLLKDNKILFSGIISDVNGIWHYDIDTQELALQMELEDNLISYIFLSNNKETINISTTIIDKEDVNGNIKNSEYLGNLNEDFKITELNNVTYNANGANSKDFLGFYEDSSKLYYQSNLKNGEENIQVYEVYEIVK